MKILNNFFGSKDEPIRSYSDFWHWFKRNEKTFFQVVKNHKNIEQDFFDKISPKLNEVKDGIFYLTGMYNDSTVELVLTPDGIIKNIVFVEELVDSAPVLDRWKFTALKPACDIKDFAIDMSGFKFNSNNLNFYSNEYPELPDEINITVTHKDFNETNKSAVTNGVFIFLDNYLGELNFVTLIDKINVISEKDAQKELIPMNKLEDFLIWRQKEFIEKYDGTRHNTQEDSYSSYKAELNSGKQLIAIINSALLKWDRKASHPWILSIEIKYKGDKTNGMPYAETFELLNTFEDEIIAELMDIEGYLNIGRQTGDNKREIYFACNDFRKPSKVLNILKNNYTKRLDISYELYKDKYWQTFNRYIIN